MTVEQRQTTGVEPGTPVTGIGIYTSTSARCYLSRKILKDENFFKNAREQRANKLLKNW